MPGCCAVNCSNRCDDGKKLFCIPRGKENTNRRKVWLHRIGRKNFTPTTGTRLCEVSNVKLKKKKKKARKDVNMGTGLAELRDSFILLVRENFRSVTLCTHTSNNNCRECRV